MNVADAFETIIIMTNNDMMKIGKQNLEEKINLSKFKIEESWLVGEKMVLNPNSIQLKLSNR